jgi:hypothetical protein
MMKLFPENGPSIKNRSAVEEALKPEVKQEIGDVEVDEQEGENQEELSK